MLSFFLLDVLNEIWDLIESVSEGLPTYISSKVGMGLVFSDVLLVAVCLETKYLRTTIPIQHVTFMLSLSYH